MVSTPKIDRPKRQQVLSLRVTDAMRHTVEQLAAYLTIKRGERMTITDVLEEALRKLAEQEGVL